EPYALGMPRSRAVASARALLRDAMPTISLHSPACIAGMIRVTAIFATPNTPHRTFFMTSHCSVTVGEAHRAIVKIHAAIAVGIPCVVGPLGRCQGYRLVRHRFRPLRRRRRSIGDAAAQPFASHGAGYHDRTGECLGAAGRGV